VGSLAGVLAYNDLNHVHGFSRSLVQADAEDAGEVIENQVPAVQRLQHQDLLDRRLSFAPHRNDHEQAAEQGTLQAAATAAIRARSACQAPGAPRSGGVMGAPEIAESVTGLASLDAKVCHNETVGQEVDLHFAFAAGFGRGWQHLGTQSASASVLP
jgi:hypothetical protein